MRQWVCLITNLSQRDGGFFHGGREVFSQRSKFYFQGEWRYAFGMRRWVCLITNLSQRKGAFFAEEYVINIEAYGGIP